MTTFTIKVNTAAALVKLEQIQAGVTNLEPFYKDLSEGLKVQIDTFFATGVGADGAPWQKNAFATVERYIKERGGFSKKTGKLTKRGQAIASSKKVLQGITGKLREGVYANATAQALTVGNSARNNGHSYAAIHTFGGPFKAFGKTPAFMPMRPFMPVDSKGKLFPKANDLIQMRLQHHLKRVLKI
jgi:phage gpG-like protein